MRKVYFLILLVAFGWGGAIAQCNNGSAFGTVTAPTTATPVTISTCSFQQEYSTINSVIGGNRYVVTASIAGTFITMRYNTPSGTVVACGVSPLQFTAPCSGTYFAHWNTNSACGTAASCMTTTIACSSCGAAASQCTMTSSFGTITAPATLNATTTITTCSFQSEYSTINSCVANRVYRVTASIAGTFITIHQGTSGGPVVASGVTPLAFTAPAAGTYYSHWNTNSACGTATSCMTTAVTYIDDACVSPCTIALSSGAGTDAQTVCVNTPITNITYNTTVATGATFAGLPAGVTGSWAGNVVTISGTPTAVGVYNYTVTLVGCTPAATATGTITVNNPPSATIVYAGTPYCSNGGTATVTRTGTAGGTYTAAPAGLTLNASTGDITLGTSTPGTYTVTYTIAAAGGCPSTTATTVVTINQLPAATISYAGSPYCSTAPTATVTRTGTAGGTYSASPAGLTINASTGTVTPNSSTPGTYTVSYTIPAAAGCGAVTATTSITITQAQNAIIFYAGTPYCQNAGTATVTRTGTAGGTYSASPAGLSINAATGAVTLGTSTPGTYTVTYTMAATGGCGITITTTTITVTATPNATIAYAASPYCSNGGTATVTQTGTTGGTYSATPAGLTLNATTGAVTLGTSTPGTYTVTYTIAAAGGCAQFTTTATITITALPVASISYAGNPYCSNAGTATVTRTGTAGGTYSAAPAGLSINASTGDVTLGTSTPGTYTVSYTIAAGAGCPAVTATTSITVTQLPAATISYAGGPYCPNATPGTVSVTQTGTTGGTYSASPAGLSINASTGTITLATSTPGTYTVTYTIAAAGGCGAVTATATVVINSLSTAPTAATATPSVNCGPANVTLTVSGGSLGTGASWKWYSGSCGGTAVGTGASITVATSGSTTYYVRAEGTCNTTTCASVSVTINTQPTVTVASSRATLKPFETATLTATVTPAGTPLQWYKNGVAISGATATTLTVTVDGLGTYTARATTGAGCTALSSGVTITAEGSNRLFITPNPNNGQFKVRYYSSAIQLGFLRHLVMYDESGRRVYDQTFPITGAYSSMNVDARHLGHGTYVVMVTDAFGREVLATGKVVLQ